jgi:hypothetical protein
LGYCLEVATEIMGNVPKPAAQRRSTAVFRILPHSVEQSEIPGGQFSLYTPFEGHIYANSYGTVRRWTGSRFEQVSEAELQKLADRGFKLQSDVSQVSGWSHAISLFDRAYGDSNYPMKFGDRPLTLKVHTSRRSTKVLVDVTDGSEVRPIWSLDESYHFVRGTTYERLFGGTGN